MERHSQWDTYNCGGDQENTDAELYYLFNKLNMVQIYFDTTAHGC